MLDFESYKEKEDEINRPECPKSPKLQKEKDPELFRIYTQQLVPLIK